MSVIDEYLDKISPTQRGELKKIRSIVKQVAPQAEESISYGLPTFKVKRLPLVYFGVFKKHMSLFPTSGPIRILKDKLTDFNTSKGAIQFTLEKPIPKELIKEILLVRLAEINKK